MSTIKTSNIRPASPIKNLSDRRQVITPSIVGETYRLSFDESSDESSDSYSSENDSYPDESYSESLSDDEEFDAESSGEV